MQCPCLILRKWQEFCGAGYGFPCEVLAHHIEEKGCQIVVQGVVDLNLIPIHVLYIIPVYVEIQIIIGSDWALLQATDVWLRAIWMAP